MEFSTQMPFIQHINANQQKLHFLAQMLMVNMVSQNAIQTVSNFARAVLLHASVHSKNNVDSDLWPIAI